MRTLELSCAVSAMARKLLSSRLDIAATLEIEATMYRDIAGSYLQSEAHDEVF